MHTPQTAQHSQGRDPGKGGSQMRARSGKSPLCHNTSHAMHEHNETSVEWGEATALRWLLDSGVRPRQPAAKHQGNAPGAASHQHTNTHDIGRPGGGASGANGLLPQSAALPSAFRPARLMFCQVELTGKPSVSLHTCMQQAGVEPRPLLACQAYARHSVQQDTLCNKTTGCLDQQAVHRIHADACSDPHMHASVHLLAADPCRHSTVWCMHAWMRATKCTHRLCAEDQHLLSHAQRPLLLQEMLGCVGCRCMFTPQLLRAVVRPDRCRCAGAKLCEEIKPLHHI